MNKIIVVEGKLQRAAGVGGAHGGYFHQQMF
jgi:hypothetical protein